MKTIQLALILAAMLFPTLGHAIEMTLDHVDTPAAAESTHDCLAIVFDASGSMRDEIWSGSGVYKINAAKTALKRVIDQIPHTTYVGLLVFVGDDYGRQSIEWLAPIGPLNKGPLKAAIDKIKPGGGTPLGSSIKQAADALLKARAEQHNYGSYQLLVVTDGRAEPPQEGSLMNAYGPEVVRRGIQLDAIGVGMEERHMLSTMAYRYWKANDEISLNAALKTAVQAESKGGAAAQADYDLLKGLPDDVAKAWLSDATNMDLENWPIGEQKPVPQDPAAAAAPGQQANADPAQAAQQAPAPASEKSGGSAIFWIFGIIAAIFVIAVVAKMADDF